MIDKCVCQSGKPFARCCQPFVSGQKHAPTPEKLMRSRYTAYALGGQGDYLLQTWWPDSAAGLTAESLSERTHDWCGLDIINKSQNGDDGRVEFKAWYRNSKGELEALHEKSRFVRASGKWFYIDGDIL